MYKKILICISLCLIFLSCDEESTSPEGMAEVSLYSNMSNSTVYDLTKGTSLAEDDVDSLKVTSLRILISDLKLHGHLYDEDKNESFKTGPYILKVDSSHTLHTVAHHSIPEGYYDKIKFEIHKFAESERVAYIDDEDFGEFATKDRYTILIDGYYYQDGIEKPFSFKSNMTENLSLKFDKELELTTEKVNNIELIVDPSLLFYDSGIIIPNEENQKTIEKNIHKVIKVIKLLNK